MLKLLKYSLPLALLATLASGLGVATTVASAGSHTITLKTGEIQFNYPSESEYYKPQGYLTGNVNPKLIKGYFSCSGGFCMNDKPVTMTVNGGPIHAQVTTITNTRGVGPTYTGSADTSKINTNKKLVSIVMNYGKSTQYNYKP